MRGEDARDDGLFSYVDLEARVPGDHPLRAIRALVDEALAALSGDFALLYPGAISVWSYRPCEVSVPSRSLR